MDKENAAHFVQQIVSKDESEQKKSDESYLFIVLFYFLGTACYVPHNIYITANEYWMYKFRDPSLPFNQTDTSQKTTFQKNFTAYANFAINVGLIVFLFLTMIILSEKIRLQKRIIGSMVVMLLLFVITSVLVYVDTDSWQTEFFITALIIGGLLSSCSAVLLVSLYQLASQFPPRCLAAQFAGQSICGILAAATQILSLLLASSVKSTALLYYVIGASVIAVIMVAFIIVLRRCEDFRKHVKYIPETAEEIAKHRPKIDLGVIKRVLSESRWLIISLVLGICCTMILHPGFTALIEPSGKGTSTWNDTYFLPVCVFLLFNTAEFVARELSNYFVVLRNIYVIFMTSVLRLALLPLILLCNIQPKSHLPVVFEEDVYFIIFMILLATSGGYLVNIAFLVYSDFCKPDEKDVSRLVILLVLIVFVPTSSLLSGVFVNLI